MLNNYIQSYIDKNSKVLDLGCGNKIHSNYSNNTTTVLFGENSEYPQWLGYWQK